MLEVGRLSAEAFTRERVLTFKKLILFITNLARKTLQLGLYDFASKIDEESATKQAFSAARKKINSIVFKLMNQKFITETYTDNDYALLKGRRILAVDGTFIQLPSSPEIAQEYGYKKNQYGNAIPSAKASTVYDVLNKLTLDSIIAHSETSEKKLAIQHIDNILQINKQADFKEQDLFIFDRGYPSMELLTKLTVEKNDYLMRCPTSFISEVRAVIKSKKVDQTIEINIFDSSRNLSVNLKALFPNLARDAKFKLRVVACPLPSGEREILITSLLDEKEFSPLVLFNLYNRRWDTEENYKFFKAIAQVENFSGKSKLAVEQDFYATALMCNIANYLAQEALDDMREVLESKKLKYPYTFNKTISLGILKDELIYVIFLKQDLEGFCDKVKSLMAKNLVAIRKNRSYPRHKSANRNYSSNTRSFL